MLFASEFSLSPYTLFLVCSKILVLTMSLTSKCFQTSALLSLLSPPLLIPHQWSSYYSFFLCLSTASLLHRGRILEDNSFGLQATCLTSQGRDPTFTEVRLDSRAVLTLDCIIIKKDRMVIWVFSFSCSSIVFFKSPAGNNICYLQIFWGKLRAYYW